MSHNPKDAKHELIILLGQTGGGKSSVGNALLGSAAKPLKESNSIKSETDKLWIVDGNFFGSGVPVSVMDTPGFLDSENRGAEFMTGIVATLKDFPKDQLKLVLITLPLSDTRANSTYQTTIDEIELMLGEQFLEHTIFIFTMSNQVKDSNLVAQRTAEWENWLITHAKLTPSEIRTCVFDYDNPQASLAPVEVAFREFSTFTPATSEKIESYLAANPNASVADVIDRVDSLKKMETDFNTRIEELIAEKEEYIKKMKAQKKTL